MLKTSGFVDPDSPLLVDPWGSRYILVPRGDDFEIATLGPDRVSGTADDFSSASARPCPPWSIPRPKRWVLLLLLPSPAVLLGLVVFLFVRLRPPRIPRTSLN